MFVHNAIVAELRSLEERAVAAQDAKSVGELADDLEFFSELMRLHHLGEESVVFPMLDENAPGYAATYLFDHEAERTHLESLIAQARTAREGGELNLKGFQEELSGMVSAGLTHIEKENTLVIPELAERLSPPEQGELVGKVLGVIPKEKMPTIVPWVVARQSDDDAEAYVRGMMAGMPAPVFEAAKGWIRGGIEEARWTELSRRVPELAS
jgi:hemerythrin-like domain-containing protein